MTEQLITDMSDTEVVDYVNALLYRNRELQARLDEIYDAHRENLMKLLNKMEVLGSDTIELLQEAIQETK